MLLRFQHQLGFTVFGFHESWAEFDCNQAEMVKANPKKRRQLWRKNKARYKSEYTVGWFTITNSCKPQNIHDGILTVKDASTLTLGESGGYGIIKNDELSKSLKINLVKSKFFKNIVLKKDINEEFLNKKEYDLIINCDSDNFLAKKHFIKKINKDYYNLAYTTIISHKKIDNNTATQVFTKQGPIAFLPISNTETSVVYSIDIKNKKFEDSDVVDLINKNNPKYAIIKIPKLNNFKLSSSNLRNYYHKNILAFGDMLHRVHPLAGQGFNMTIRDLRVLSQIIDEKIELGIQLDSSILDEFEKKTKDKNLVFSKAIGLIYEIFNLDKNVKNKNFSKILKTIGKNKNFNDYFVKLADLGLNE